MYAGLDVLGNSNSEGGADEPSVFGNDYLPLTQARDALDSEIQAWQKITNAKNAFKNDLESTTGGLTWKGKDITLPDSTTISVKKNWLGKNYEVVTAKKGATKTQKVRFVKVW